LIVGNNKIGWNKYYLFFVFYNMDIKALIIKIAVCVIFTNPVMSQLRSDLPMKGLPINTQGLSKVQNLSILDPNRFSINHSFGMSMTSFGGNSLSLGSYTNQMNYMIKDNMRLSTSFSLSSPMNGINPYANNGLGGTQIFYGASLDYQPTKNLFVKFSMDNYPRYGYSRPYSRLYRSR